MARKYTLDSPAPARGTIDYAAELNDQQLAAVTSSSGASLVIAGAGSGKTRTLTYRVAWLLEQGLPANNILLLTFTNKAAREMLERVTTLLPGAGGGIWGGTFHSIGNRILRQHAERVGFRPGFTIMDRDDQEEMIDGIVAREGLRTSDKRFPKGGVLADIFSYSVNTGLPVEKVLLEKHLHHYEHLDPIVRVQTLYEGRRKEANVMDFDDLLSKTLELFKTCEDVALSYQTQFRQVLVDEYQDTNLLQAELVDAIASKHGNIMVVGDDAQSIYSWRGANFENILQFPQRYPGAQVFKIETNYRSVPEVLNVANAAILANERQFPKNLTPARAPHTARPALVPLATSTEQAVFIGQRVQELYDDGISLNEMAVLYRAHYHSMEVQLEFTRRGIPFTLTSGLRFFEQAHIKDVAAFMKFAVNPADEVAFKRMAKLLPGIGVKSAESLWGQTARVLQDGGAFELLLDLKVPSKASVEWKQLVLTLAELVPDGKPQPPSEMIQTVLMALYDDYMKEKFANYEIRRDDLNTLEGYAGQFEDTGEFLSQLALLGSVETADAFAGEGEQVTLSSVHQAKGLEWKVVFIPWLTEGMFPSTRSMQTPEGVEEERRLFYVAVTRCQDELHLLYPELRTHGGYGDPYQRPSRFLQEIPEALMEAWEVSAPPPDRSGYPF